ncbi:MAG TPA: 30S ribosomal protein S30 [Flavobacteriia bacterium]|jgi:putative sigma-54 modulation protein|nr:30S ribosomal protein S30 [Flavobacteriia bacterium]
MEINIQFVKMPTSEHMEAFAIKKLKKLAKKYDWIIRAKVFLKLEQKPKGKGKICDIQLSVPGPRIFASSNEDSFEAAVDETIRDLQIMLKKRKKEMKPY